VARWPGCRPFDAAEIRAPIQIFHGGSDGPAPLPVLRRSLARAARVQERIYPDGETLTRLGFAGTLGWAGVYISLAGLDRSCHIVPPPGEVVVSMRPVCVFAKGPGEEIERLRADLRDRWRQAARAVMVQLSL
jgi:hypothetical protein